MSNHPGQFEAITNKSTAMKTAHDGIIDDHRVYTTHAMTRIFGARGNDTIDRWLTELDCKATRDGSQTFVTGPLFRMTIEKNSRLAGDD